MPGLMDEQEKSADAANIHNGNKQAENRKSKVNKRKSKVASGVSTEVVIGGKFRFNV